MESLKDLLANRDNVTGNFQELAQKTLQNPEVAAFITHYQLTGDAVLRSYSKFYEYVAEKENKAQDYEPVLIFNQGFADVAYRETAARQKKEQTEAKNRCVTLVGLPQTLKTIAWVDVLLDDSQRQVAYKAIVDFIDHYPDDRGLYLYGDFGVGKSFMMAAMAQTLAEKNISTTLLHYPTFIAETDYDNYRTRVAKVKLAPVLVLDDIGAEVNSNWVRDSILQVILQHRMDNALPTFFTSNFSLKDLETHLAETRNTDDIWPAKRVLERIKYLAREIHLEGINRRHN